MRKYSQKRHHKKGFVLIELLIAVAILGILAAVVISNVIGLSDKGQTEAAKAELSEVQTAMNIMMANLGLTSVNVTAETNNMAAFPAGCPLHPNYLRTATSKGTYSCDATGLVTQASIGYSSSTTTTTTSKTTTATTTFTTTATTTTTTTKTKIPTVSPID